jgi:predicted XRE-type DNA-binding protein
MKPKPKETSKRVAYVTDGSGNLFADLGLPNPEQELLKAQLTLQIYTILKDSGMTQVEIAKILGVRQPQVSLLMRNRAGNFSVGRLMEFLTALRQDVKISVRPIRKEHGVLSVVSAYCINLSACSLGNIEPGSLFEERQETTPQRAAGPFLAASSRGVASRANLHRLRSE